MKSCLPALLLAVLAFIYGDAGAAEETQYLLAVMDFETGSAEIKNLSETVPAMLSASLAKDKSLAIVSQSDLKKALKEINSGKSKPIEEVSAKIGKSTGASFIITGRAFVVGDQMYITAKVIAAETGMVGAQLAKGPVDGNISDIVSDLSGKISAYMAENAGRMLPKEQEVDVVATLRERLKGKSLPKFSVNVSESHVNRPVADLAVQAEIMNLLNSIGANVVPDNGLDSPEKADVLISGNAFSEYSGTTKNLISAKGSAELKAIDVQNGKVLAIGRNSTTAADLSENTAARTARERAASNALSTLLPEAVKARESGKK